MKKTILFIDQNLNGGGAERVLCTIIRALSTDEFDIHILLIGKLGQLGHLLPECVNIHELNISNTRKALYVSISKIRNICPDVVYTTLGRTTVLSVLAKPFCHQYRLVVRYASMPSREIESGDLKGWRLFLQKLVYRYADICIAQTEEMAVEMESILNIESSKIHVIYNPVDTAYILKALEGVSNPFCVDHINILASGRIVHLKGFDILINAMENLTSSIPNIHLHIIGEDVLGMRDVLETNVINLGVQENIHFHGFTHNPYPYYKFCDVFVLSSRYEGMPNVLLECIYLEVPVVATRCAPIVERLIQEGVNGYVVDVDDVDSISKAIKQSLLLRKINNRHNYGDVEQIVNLLR